MSPTPRSPRKTQRVSPHPASGDTSNSNHVATTKPALPKPHISLEAFISNLVFAVFIQGDEEIADLVSIVHSVVIWTGGNANGTTLSFEGHKEFAAGIRRNIGDRRLVTESFTVMPDDPEGLTGTSAHNIQFSGVQAGEEVKTSVVVVETVKMNENGQRQVKMTSFVYRTDRV